MGTNDKEKLQFAYCGKHEAPIEIVTDSAPLSPTPDVARLIALGVLGGSKGRYRITVHCQQRMSERDFDVFDIEYVIRNGACVGSGEFVAEFRQHKYTFRGDIDGTNFDAAFALSADHDLIESPLLFLLSGCFKTRSGKRKKSF